MYEQAHGKIIISKLKSTMKLLMYIMYIICLYLLFAGCDRISEHRLSGYKTMFCLALIVLQFITWVTATDSVLSTVIYTVLRSMVSSAIKTGIEILCMHAE